MNMCGTAVRRCVPPERLVIGALVAGAIAMGTSADAQITIQNSGSTVGLLATNAPDIQCMGIGQAWMTGGVGVGDFNNDGWPDLFVIGGGLAADKLFINNGDGTFTNQAATWGVAALHGGVGVAVGDYNKDGWQDIYVTSFGSPGQPGQPGKHRLYRNNGNGSFSEVAVQAGVNVTTTNVANGYGAAFGDYDLDGNLDLFVASWKDLIGIGNGGTGNRLFHNNGNGTFTDVTSAALGNAMAGVWGFQPAFVDMNGDRYPEILLTGDFGTSRYLINNANGTFTNFTSASGTGVDSNGMGQTVGDFNRDGILDWYVTSIFQDNPPPNIHDGNALYQGLGANLFQEISVAAGANDGGWGWGTIAVDLDRDGWTDIVEGNGRNAGEWANEREYLWRNNADGTFTEMGVAAGLDLAGDARGLVWLDADRDGDQDFIITVNNAPMRYYKNITPSKGAWLNLKFNTATNPLLAPNGFGTRVVLSAGGQSYVQYFSGGPSYLSTSELGLYFGLGNVGIIDQLQVFWSRGQVTTLSNVAVNQFLTIAAPIPSDINADGVVNVADLLAVINTWGPCPAPPAACVADTNGDGIVNAADLLRVINNWG